MKSLFAVAGFVALAGAASAQNLIISEVVDATLAGGNPKFVEITNTGDTAYTFAGGGIIIQSNDSADTAVDVDMTGVTINPGDSFVIQSSANNGVAIFESTYGFAADLYSSAGFGNGDDRYILSDGTNLLDIYGVFGSRAPDDLATYNYLDSYAYRLPAFITGDGQTYQPGEWFRPGPDALEGLDAAGIALVTTPGTHIFIPAPGAAALLGLSGLIVARRRRN